MLTSQARESLRGVQTVIVDEVHALAGGKRGAHLALSLERLDALRADQGPAQRIGLSATVRPPEEVARFLGGALPVTIVAPPSQKRLDLKIVVPVEDMADLQGSDDTEPGRRSRTGPTGGRCPAATRRGSIRSGRTSRSACSTLSRAIARRSCSPTRAGSPSGSAPGSTTWLPSVLPPTTRTTKSMLATRMPVTPMATSQLDRPPSSWGRPAQAAARPAS